MTVAAVAAFTAGLAGYATPAGASRAPHPTALTAVRQTGGVSAVPATGTPSLTNTGTQEVIKQIVQCGNLMYAVGSFSSITQKKVAFPRHNIFSFSASPPYTITSWAPDVNDRINTIAFNGNNCAHAYLGGRFTSINGTAVKFIAEIDTTVGNVVPAFGTTASGGEVNTLVAANGHLLAGGFFFSVNGGKDKYMASLNPVTGKDDGFLQLDLSGHYHYCTTSKPPQCTSNNNHTAVYNQKVSHGGTLDLIEGNFTSAGGLARQQIFMINMATDPATVTGWTSPQWDGSSGNLPNGFPYQCTLTEAFYIRDAAWSPDDQTIYTASTGYHPWNWPDTGKRAGLCDSVAAWPATKTQVPDTWIEYSGCDSYYSIAADSTDVYAAGHIRWGDNINGCNNAGAGAIPDPGLQGIDASTGQLVTDTQGTAGLYSMDRANAGYMLITSAGLWIASTNRFGSNRCGGVSGHAGICLLPYTS
ncbi:MAG TPA: hypothetical protein VGI74_03085 [Streptosporangiaceae bacterium]